MVAALTLEFLPQKDTRGLTASSRNSFGYGQLVDNGSLGPKSIAAHYHARCW